MSDGPTLLDDAIKVLEGLVSPELLRPRVGIVCGSGLGGIADRIQDHILVPYEKIPGFALSTGSSSFGPKIRWDHNPFATQFTVTRVLLLLAMLASTGCQWSRC